MEGWAYFNNHHGGLVVLYKWSGSLKDERYKHPLHTMLCDFSVITPRCYKDVYVKSFFSDSKSRVNRHHVSLGSF